MSQVQTVLNNIFSVLVRPKYALLLIISSVLLFSIFIFLNNIPLFTSAFEITQDVSLLSKVFLNSVEMVIDIGGLAVFSSIIVVSVLGGLSITLLTYHFTTTRKLEAKSGILNFGGIFGGALSSACAACSTALISILGVAGGLAIFPLKGLELSLLSIAVLIISIFMLSKNLNRNGVCEMK